MGLQCHMIKKVLYIILTQSKTKNNNYEYTEHKGFLLKLIIIFSIIQIIILILFYEIFFIIFIKFFYTTIFSQII